MAATGSADDAALVPGLGYQWLYGLLPYPIEAAAYQPFTLDHILTQMQLLILAVFAFILLKRLMLYPAEKPGVILDTDWLYRKVGYGLFRWVDTVWSKIGPATPAIGDFGSKIMFAVSEE